MQLPRPCGKEVIGVMLKGWFLWKCVCACVWVGGFGLSHCLFNSTIPLQTVRETIKRYLICHFYSVNCVFYRGVFAGFGVICNAQITVYQRNTWNWTLYLLIAPKGWRNLAERRKEHSNVALYFVLLCTSKIEIGKSLPVKQNCLAKRNQGCFFFK